MIDGMKTVAQQISSEFDNVFSSREFGNKSELGEFEKFKNAAEETMQNPEQNKAPEENKEKVEELQREQS